MKQWCELVEDIEMVGIRKTLQFCSDQNSSRAQGGAGANGEFGWRQHARVRASFGAGEWSNVSGVTWGGRLATARARARVLWSR